MSGFQCLRDETAVSLWFHRHASFSSSAKALCLLGKNPLFAEWLGPNHSAKAYQMPTQSPPLGRESSMKPKWNRGFTCMFLNTNGFQASEGVKPISTLFLWNHYHNITTYTIIWYLTRNSVILISQHITRPDNETGFRLSYDDKRHVILSDIAISRTTIKYSAYY